MTNKAFIEETKKIIKGTSSNACRYWKFLQNPQDSENIYHFCMKMFEALMSSGKDQFLDDDHEAQYSTLLVLEFYKNTKLKPEKWIDDTLKTFKENKAKLFEHAKWIVELFLKNSQQSQFALNFLSSLCLIFKKFSWQVEPGQEIEEALKQAGDYYDIIEFKRRDKPYKKLSHLSYCQVIKESKIAAFSYCCFLDFLRSSNYQPKKKIWLHVIDTLRGLIHALRHTSKAYELLSVFLHTIGNLLKFYGCAYEDVLKQLIYYMNHLRNCPGSNADLAYQLFTILHQELKCAGTAFRKELKRKFVNLDLKKAEDLSSRKYYLSYRKISFGSPEYCSISNLRKLMIYNILGCCKIQSISKLWSIVQPLDQDTTYSLYFKLMKILDIATNLQTYQNIQKLIKESIIQLFKVGWVPYKKIKKEEEEELAALIIPENTQKYFQFPNFQIISVKPQNLMNKQYQLSIVQLLSQLSQFPYNQFFYSRFLQFIFLGNDQQLSRILQQICNFLIDLPPNQYQKIAFFIIPIKQGDCYLAEYLSYKDLWYRRFVYNVFRERTLFPVVSLDDPQIKDTFPSYLYTKTMHMYVRQAQRKVPFQIFKCQLSIGEAGELKVIYFINHILIGASLECELLKNDQKKQKKNNYVDGIQTYLQKIKKVSPTAVDISVRFKEPGTELLVTRQQKFLSIQDLQICNTPRPYFFGYRPNPLNQFVQVSIMTTQSGKIFRNQLETRQNFKRHSDMEIAQAFRDLFINMTAQTVVVARSEGMKERIRLLIDGVQVTDVQKFKISAVLTSSKLPLTLPVRCFLSFQA